MPQPWCSKCLAAQEKPVEQHELFACPTGVCPVCWYRYGKYIPVCTTAGALPTKVSKDQ